MAGSIQEKFERYNTKTQGNEVVDITLDPTSGIARCAKPCLFDQGQLRMVVDEGVICRAIDLKGRPNTNSEMKSQRLDTSHFPRCGFPDPGVSL